VAAATLASSTFHATQMAAWQRGIGNGLQLDKLLPSSR
jgi:hypothetical protein